MSLSKPHHQSSASNDSPEAHGVGVEIVPRLISTDEEGGSDTNKNDLPEYDHYEDVASSSNTKGTSTIKTIVGGSVVVAMLAVVGTGAYGMGVNHAASKITTSMMSTVSKSAKTPSPSGGKAGKKVCLEYGFFNDVVAKGSSDPIGADGPNGPGACLASPPLPSAVCCDELAAALISGNFDDYYKCLSDPDNGPVLVGNWWLQRDNNNGQIFFTEDAVCGKITVDAADSRTRLELWDDKYIDMRLDQFKEFKVDYNVVSTAGNSGGYPNMYVRTAAGRNTYYDCSFVFLIPNVAGSSGTFVITPETVIDSARRWTGTNPGDNNGCPGQSSPTKITIKDYLAANPNAVMGVGNGEFYAFTLNTGSTGQNNNGQEICWSDVSIERVDAAGTKFFDTYEFTTL